MTRVDVIVVGGGVEVDDRLEAHAANLFEVGMARDADDQRGEEKRCDDRLDQVEKDLAEHAELNRSVRPVVTDLGADEYRTRYGWAAEMRGYAFYRIAVARVP